MALLISLLPVQLAAQSLPEIDSTVRDYSGELPRLKPVPPSEALSTFELAEGFDLKLVAAEPLVADPIAMCFDSHERLFVVEMLDYSEQATESLGKIALLEDHDHDGVMDRRTEFATGLSWPTAIWTWQEGVIVAHPPYLSWFSDRDGDNVAEVREDWFVGFGRSNVQGLVNSLRWSPRGYIVGATSSAAAQLSPGNANDSSKERLLSLRGRDFAIDPLNKSISARSGGGQHGLFLNAWGDKFVTSNSDHLQQIVELESWLATRKTSIPMPAIRRSIAADGPQAEVFRISPVEPWRIVRTRLRTKGIVPGPVEGGGRAAGYFTGATGTCITPRDLQFGVNGFDTALVCDVGSNLVHRKQLMDHGLFWSAKRIDDASELVRSRDTWFRPVQLTDGPDGAVYIADMYREVIEHPKSLPPVIKQHLDLTSGRDRGRIYRLAKRSLDISKPTHTLASLSTDQWVGELASPIAWRRLTASQLLLQWLSRPENNGSTHSIARSLSALATQPLEESSTDTAAAAGTILALHLLSRLDQFDSTLALDAIRANKHPRCTEHILELAGENGLLADANQTDTTPNAVQNLVDQLLLAELDQSRLQLAMCKLASTAEPALRDRLIGHVFDSLDGEQIKEPLVQWAIAEVAPGLASSRIASESSNGPNPAEWLRLLMPTWPNEFATNPALRVVVRERLCDPSGSNHAIWLSSFLALPPKSRDEMTEALGGDTRELLVINAKSTLANAPFSPLAAQQLSLLDDNDFAEWTGKHFDERLPSTVARLIVEGLKWHPSRTRASLLIEKMPQMTPSIREALLREVAQSDELISELVAQIESGTVAKSWIPMELKRQIRSRTSGDLRAKIDTLFQQASPDRAAVIEQYAAALDSQPPSTNDLKLGSEVFAKSCAQCHRINSVGADVGPPLKQLGSKTPRELLETILDPSREVDPKYLGYKVLLTDGRAIVGIIASESVGQITLKQSGGKPEVVQRTNIELIESTDASLMPDGLEQQITPDSMRALLQYLRQATR